MKKKVLFSVGGLCVLASVAMYVIGDGSSHLSELKDFFWVPLPLAVVSVLGAFKS
jgi:hypothetical protein